MGKKKKVQEEDSGDPGVVLFTALMLILLSFFILMNAIAVIDDTKARIAIGSLLSEFASMGTESSATGNNPDIHTGNNPYIKIEHFKLVLDNKLRNLGLEGNVEAFLRGKDFVIVLPGHLLASESPDRIPETGKKLIGTVTELLTKTKKEIRVEGHSSGDKPLGDRPVNSNDWRTSQQRAIVVAEEMKTGGISSQQLTVGGFGATRPMLSNETLEGMRKNSRVEIVVVDGLNDEILLHTPREVKIGRWKFKEIEYNGKKRFKKI